MDSRSSRRCPLFLRPKSKPDGREKPIRVAAIRVVTKYSMSFFLQAPRNAPRGDRTPFLLCKGSTPGAQQKNDTPKVIFGHARIMVWCSLFVLNFLEAVFQLDLPCLSCWTKLHTNTLLNVQRKNRRVWGQFSLLFGFLFLAYFSPSSISSACNPKHSRGIRSAKRPPQP